MGKGGIKQQTSTDSYMYMAKLMCVMGEGTDMQLHLYVHVCRGMGEGGDKVANTQNYAGSK